MLGKIVRFLMLLDDLAEVLVFHVLFSKANWKKTIGACLLASLLLVQGSWECLSFDATWRTPGTDPVRQEESTWLGLRMRLYEAEQQAFALGLLTRVGLPLIEGARARLETGVALGGADDTWSWLVNAGARTRVGGYDEMSSRCSCG